MTCFRRLVFTLAIVLLLWSAATTQATTPSNLFHEVTLCQEVHGFAGEVNDHLTIKIPADVPETGAPIYVIARAFPVHLGTMVQDWLSMNATVDGVRDVVATSNDNGIMLISGVSAGKTLHINVNRVRTDGPVPFRLYTYQANEFTCAIPLSESNSFIAPLPNDKSLVFFAISTTKVFPCATVWIEHDHGMTFMDMTTAPPETRYFYQVDSANKMHLYQSTDTICHRTASTDPLVIAYYSHEASSKTPLVRIKVAYGVGPASEAIPDTPGGGAEDDPAAPPANGGNAANGQKTSGGGFFATLGRLLLVAVLLGTAYLVVGSIYNYRSRGITTFPDYVPHADTFRSAAATVATAANPSHRYEYSPVSASTGGKERNPFEV